MLVSLPIQHGGITVSLEENKARIRRYIDEVWNHQHLELLEQFVAQPEAVRTALQDLRTAYPDLHLTLDLLIAEGDWVAYHWTMRGTHELGIAVSWTGATFNRIVDGKIVADWVETDRLAILHQLGVFHEAGPPRPAYDALEGSSEPQEHWDS